MNTKELEKYLVENFSKDDCLYDIDGYCSVFDEDTSSTYRCVDCKMKNGGEFAKELAYFRRLYLAINNASGKIDSIRRRMHDNIGQIVYKKLADSKFLKNFEWSYINPSTMMAEIPPKYKDALLIKVVRQDGMHVEIEDENTSLSFGISNNKLFINIFTLSEKSAAKLGLPSNNQKIKEDIAELEQKISELREFLTQEVG